MNLMARWMAALALLLTILVAGRAAAAADPATSDRLFLGHVTAQEASLAPLASALEYRMSLIANPANSRFAKVTAAASLATAKDRAAELADPQVMAFADRELKRRLVEHGNKSPLHYVQFVLRRGTHGELTLDAFEQIIIGTNIEDAIQGERLTVMTCGPNEDDALVASTEGVLRDFLLPGPPSRRVTVLGILGIKAINDHEYVAPPGVPLVIRPCIESARAVELSWKVRQDLKAEQIAPKELFEREASELGFLPGAAGQAYEIELRADRTKLKTFTVRVEGAPEIKALPFAIQELEKMLGPDKKPKLGPDKRPIVGPALLDLGSVAGGTRTITKVTGPFIDLAPCEQKTDRCMVSATKTGHYVFEIRAESSRGHEIKRVERLVVGDPMAEIHSGGIVRPWNLLHLHATSRSEHGEEIRTRWELARGGQNAYLADPTSDSVSFVPFATGDFVARYHVSATHKLQNLEYPMDSSTEVELHVERPPVEVVALADWFRAWHEDETRTEGKSFLSPTIGLRLRLGSLFKAKSDSALHRFTPELLVPIARLSLDWDNRGRENALGGGSLLGLAMTVASVQKFEFDVVPYAYIRLQERDYAGALLGLNARVHLVGPLDLNAGIGVGGVYNLKGSALGLFRGTIGLGVAF